VLKDLKEQYNKIVDPTPQQKMQYNAEVERVQQIAKTDAHDVYTDIGEHLGKLMDAHDAIGKLLLKEQLEAKQVYKGEESVGKRALRRILITSRLDAIWTEIRETMVYQSPPELGALWGKFDEMRQQILAEQEVAHEEEIRQAQIASWRRRRRIAEVRAKAMWVSAVLFVIAWAVGLMWLTTRSMITRTSLGH
jgi:hypothetical protein